MNKKVYIRTFGCQMNDRDSEALMGMFLDRGYGAAETPQEADTILVNTCSVREHAENRAISFLGSLKKLKVGPSTSLRINKSNHVIGLIGCMAKRRGQEILKKMPHINLICAPGRFAKIPGYIDKILKENIRIIDLEDTGRDEFFYESGYRVNPESAQAVISTGCSNYCTYCVVPYVRGVLRLRKPGDIIDEIKRNVSRGIKSITLLGQNVNDYLFRDKGYGVRGKEDLDFVGLLREIDKIEGLETVDFITSHPKNTSLELFKLMVESKKIKKHLHLPFQAGSNRILKLMNRGYTREQYLKLAESFRNITGGTLSTDVMVGFPTETNDDFLQTKDIIERAGFSYAYIFKYSPRPGTKAFSLKDDVDEKTKAGRHKILLELQKKISLNTR